MIVIPRKEYDLLLSYNCCDIFNHYNVTEMHGINLKDCIAYPNTPYSAYIAGLCNVIPNSNRNFVFLNLNRCNTDIETFALIMHELLHMSFDLHTDEEELITWAENEAFEVFNIAQSNIIHTFASNGTEDRT